MPGDLETAYDERAVEVEAYLGFLEELEAAAQTGAPRFSPTGAALSPQQIQILRAGVFVQLYNLVEATMTNCLDAVSLASYTSQWTAADLNPNIRTEWVKVTVQANKDLNADNRLRKAVLLAESLVRSDPLAAFKLEKGGGGNWNDKHIEDMLERVGLKLKLTPTVREAVRRKERNDLGALGLVVKLRNDLAHGSISFSECGATETITSLRRIAGATVMYLRTVVRSVERYIDRHEYLVAARRPQPAQIQAATPE